MAGLTALDAALGDYAAGRLREALAGVVAIPGVGRTPAGRTLIGRLLVDLGRPADALAQFDAALVLAPGDAAALTGRGKALTQLGRWAEALAAHDGALAAGVTPERLRDRGWALHKSGRFAEAIADFDRVLALDPGDADAETCRGMARLILGDYAGGLADYEARYRRRHKAVAMPDTFDCPVWAGEDLAGRTILAHAEQGLGDAIQFARMAPLLAERGARVVLGTPSRLVRLFRPLADRVAVRDASLPGEAFDFTVPLMSLPHRLGVTVETVPWPGPYLTPEPERVAAWGARLGAGVKVGLAWQGNPAGAIDIGRSPPLASLAALAGVAGVRLIALQRTHGLDQLADLPAGLRVETLGDDVDAGPDAFVDTAAVMAHLDCVVTSDTAIAHLAGALGRPGLVLLQRVPDWRWGATAATTPWYPSLALVRQTTPGDWAEVGRRAAAELARRLGR